MGKSGISIFPCKVLSNDPSFEGPTFIPSPEGGHPEVFWAFLRFVLDSTQIGYGLLLPYPTFTIIRALHCTGEEEKPFLDKLRPQTSVQFGLLKSSAINVSLIASFC
jgi:hypothetical protein